MGRFPRSLSLAIAAFATSLFTGCGQARVYHHVTLPLDVNFNNTPVADSASSGDIKRFQYYVDVQWDSNGIGDIARQAGMSKIYYADRTVMSILGVWTQVFVTVYGE